jgi:signal transduction histidine kinase
VTGVAQVLSRTTLRPHQQEMVQIIEQSALTLERLLSDVLDLARVESGRIEIQNEPFHLGDTVRATAASPSCGRRRRVSPSGWRSPPSRRHVRGDAAG